MVQAARSPPLGLGPSSTGMYRPRLGVLTAAAHEGDATLAEGSPASSGRSTRRVPRTMVLPGTGLVAGRRPCRAMRPSERARACGSRGGTACLGRIVRGLAAGVPDDDKRLGLHPPPVHRHRANDAFGGPPPGRP